MENASFGLSNGHGAKATAPAVAKSVRILEFVAGRRGAGISDIARATGLGKSTVHGLVTALVAEKLLVRGESRNGFTLGPRLIDFGAEAREQVLLDAVETVLTELAQATEETAFFGRVEGDRVRILARSESDRSLKLSATVGATIPVLAGALGKAYLATLDAEAAETYLRDCQLPRYTARAVTGRQGYAHAADRARRDGFAVERGEYLPGIAAAASALAWSGATYVVWVVGIESVLDEAELRSIGARTRDAAEAIRRRLEGASSDDSERSVS